MCRINKRGMDGDGWGGVICMWALQQSGQPLHNRGGVTWMLYNRLAFTTATAAALLFQWRHRTAVQTRAPSRRGKHPVRLWTSAAVLFSSCFVQQIPKPYQDLWYSAYIYLLCELSRQLYCVLRLHCNPGTVCVLASRGRVNKKKKPHKMNDYWILQEKATHPNRHFNTIYWLSLRRFIGMPPRAKYRDCSVSWILPARPSIPHQITLVTLPHF